MFKNLLSKAFIQKTKQKRFYLRRKTFYLFIIFLKSSLPQTKRDTVLLRNVRRGVSEYQTQPFLMMYLTFA